MNRAKSCGPEITRANIASRWTGGIIFTSGSLDPQPETRVARAAALLPETSRALRQVLKVEHRVVVVRGVCLPREDHSPREKPAHYVPVAQFYSQIATLKNTRSLTARLLTRAESAQNHCQIGNFGLALQVITAWLELTPARAQGS